MFWHCLSGRMKAVYLIVVLLLETTVVLALPTVTSQSEIPGQFNQPTSALVTESGIVFVLDGASNRVVARDPSGHVFSFGEQQLSLPMGIALGKDRLIVADTGNHRLVEFDLAGKQTRIIPLESAPIPNSQFGPPRETDLLLPEPVAVVVQHNTLWWTDRRHHRVCSTNPESLQTEQCFGRHGMQDGQFQYPYQIAFDRDEYLTVADSLNAKVQLFNRLGDHIRNIGHFGVRPGELYRPNGIAYDKADNLFVSDAYNGTISIYHRGEFQRLLSDQSGKPVRFTTPTGLFWHNDTLIVTATGEHTIYQLELEERDLPVTPLPDTADVAKQNCVICHLSWSNDYLPPANQDSEVPPVARDTMCYSCHHGVVIDSRNQIGIHGQHPSIHDADDVRKKRLEIGREDNIADEFPLTAEKELMCTSCHTPHTRKQSGDVLYPAHRNSWMRIPNNGGDLCENCHESNAETARQRDPDKSGKNHPLAMRLQKPPQNNARNYPSDPHLQKGLPGILAQSGASLGHDNEMICQSCHQVHGGTKQNLLAISDDNGKLCHSCHQRQYSENKKQARKKGVHPVNIKLDDLKLDKPVKINGKTVNKVTCQTCHNIHDGKPGTVLLPKQIKTTEELCVTCHQRQHAEDKDDAISKGIHPVNAKLDEPVKINGKQIKVVGCLSCHAVHRGVNNTPALVEDHHDGKLCEHCHEGKRKIVATDHDLRITAKDSVNRHDELPKKSGVCGSCHSMHRGKARQPWLFAAKIVKTDKADHPDRDPIKLKTDGLCLNCHQKQGIAEDKPIDHFAHPYQTIVLRSDKDTMPLFTQDDEKEPQQHGMIACITCHEPHHWKPETEESSKKRTYARFTDNQEGTVLNSFLRQKGIKKTFCVDCHGMNALIKYKYYHDKSMVKEEAIDYIQ